MGYIRQPWVSVLRKHIKDSAKDWEKQELPLTKQGIFSQIGGRSEAALACASYTTCSVLLTLSNKAIFSENKLNFPWMLLGVQSVVVALIISSYYIFTKKSTMWRGELFRQLMLPCVFFTSFIFTNAKALRYISLPILTVIKSLAPMGIALMERLFFKEKVSGGTYAAMFLILVGNSVTVLHDVEFHPIGYFWAFLNVLMNIAYVVSLRYCLSDEFSTGEKTLHSNVLACTLIFPMAFMNGEWAGFFYEFSKTTVQFRILFFVSCILATGIGASVFWVIHAASGSTLSFVGAANKVLVVILGAVIFAAKISPAGWVGVCLGTIASIVFAASKVRDSQRRNAEPKDKQTVLNAIVEETKSHGEREEAAVDTKCAAE